jgi:outer membrane cobalamin receptor
MRVASLLFLYLSFNTFVCAQKFTISGYIKDKESGESLIGATVFQPKTTSGTSANAHGYYSLTLPNDSVTLVYSYVGYQPLVLKFKLAKDTVINTWMASTQLLSEVVITATKAEEIHESTKMSSFSVPIEQIKALPALMGEVDIFKILQLMPGVQSGSEGSTGLYVRGGGPDQNLILLDDVPIYNASHLFGFFSIFNADAINHVELVKGGFPARYGGRLSSVININMKDGDMKKIKGEGSVGIIAAKATVEGPIVKDKTSFIFSARRTYIDILAQPFIQNQNNGNSAGYYFYDLNVKLNHIINPNNRLYLSTYLGDDKAYAQSKSSYRSGSIQYDEKDDAGLKWGNVITALRWNHVFHPKLFSNFTATYSRYLFDISQNYQETQTQAGLPTKNVYYQNQYYSGIRDYAAKADVEYFPTPNHLARFGLQTIGHRFSPGVLTIRSSERIDSVAGASITNAVEISAYAEDDWKISNRLKANYGLHASSFSVDGTSYSSLQPRLSARFLLTNDLALKASFAKMTQFIHLLTNAGLGLPTDLWVPSMAKVKPQQANQWAVGLAKTYKSEYEFSMEAYYKNMTNLIEYKDGASYLSTDEDWQNKVATNGQGKSYGLEVLLQKKTGVVTGWIGYTLSKSTRQFDALNFGKEFPYKYDRRHDVSIALSHQWNKRMDFSMAWVFGTGNAITLPVANYEGASSNVGNIGWPNYSPDVTYYGDRNSYRMNSYHRLDLSFSWWKDKKWGQRKWTLSIYNAYNQKNPFYMDITRDNSGNKKFVQYSLFPILPSITYSFKF